MLGNRNRGTIIGLAALLVLVVGCVSVGYWRWLVARSDSDLPMPVPNVPTTKEEGARTDTDTLSPDQHLEVYQKDVRPLLETYCIRCHGPEKMRGKVDFAAFADAKSARNARRLWRKAIVQMESGEMPPAQAKQPGQGDRAKLIQWMKEAIERDDPRDRDPGPALVRRLSRPEYNRTMRDLLGIDFDVGDMVGIVDDSQGFGFANQVGVLALSPTLMEKYFAAADNVLDRLLGSVPDLPTPKPAEIAKLKPAKEEPAKPMPPKNPTLAVQYRCAGVNGTDNQLRPHFQIINLGNNAVPLRELTLRYWFTGEGAKDFQHWCDYARLDAKNVTRAVKKLDQPVKDADAYVEIGFTEGSLDPKGSTGEIQIRIAAQDWMQLDQKNDYSFDPKQTQFTESPRVTLYREGKLAWGQEPSGPPTKSSIGTPDLTVAKEAKMPSLELRQAREAIFIAAPGDGMSEKEAARKIITAFARRAWRRPVQTAEIDRLLAVYDRAAGKGADFTNAVRPMLKAVLVSPHFLLRVEHNPAGKSENAYRRVNDHELAVRLSYFLWSSMPDHELIALAEQGRLSDPAELEKQTRRMLAHPKGQALTDCFGVPWLQLGNLATARPTMEFFPSFGPSLKDAMYKETTLFFDKLRQEDRSVLELIDADYTYVNEELARHYGLAGVSGPEMRKVSLKPSDRRGGVLGMGSVLASTSHTHRTSPTLRGKYVLEVLLGTPPPPPPANVGVLKDDNRVQPPKTFRESLERHSRDPNCAACHSKIDPLGFGLENFDGIGRWREGGPTLDASGELPTGEKFSGPIELKKLLLKRQDQVLLNLSEQMLSYALGRPLEDCDERAVIEIQTALRRNENRFSALILGIVKSFPFQHRRVKD
ncbi:MAG: DUF1592 domain-containing protein [Planctomycetes bacterium]|nr:DUF1592 domain-containing protein [Planctomycetota bacterium]